MNIQDESCQKAVYWLSLIGAIFFLGLASAITVMEMYIRWKINQDFTLLGPGEFQALAFSGTALLLGLIYWCKR